MTLCMDQFERGRPLNALTTLGIGGPAEYYIEVKEAAALQAVISFCTKHNLPFFILGKGSNLLFDDKGFAGVVIANRIQFLEKPEEGVWHVGAGYSFSLLGAQTARLGWSGLEFASGIPGSVGGAVYMNAGANGNETCECLVSVDFVTEEGQLLTLPKEKLAFGYRFSSFQQRLGAIAGATFKLTKGEEARQKQLDIIQYRTKTQPYGAKSAGCVFRNPTCGHAATFIISSQDSAERGKAGSKRSGLNEEGMAKALSDEEDRSGVAAAGRIPDEMMKVAAHAGALIDQCGLKGMSVGDAQVSQLHANFLINDGNASSADFLHLIEKIRERVKEQTGYDLEPEVRCIPYKKNRS